jgi:hypothetical protein
MKASSMKALRTFGAMAAFTIAAYLAQAQAPGGAVKSELPFLDGVSGSKSWAETSQPN